MEVKTSNVFWEIKALAILSVFYAHLVWEGDWETGIAIYESIGCLGVPLFMLMAGFFDAKSRTPLRERLIKLFIPLFIWGTLTFILKFYLDPLYTFSTFPSDFPKWIYGCGSWYYFIPVLFWCLLLVRYINCWVLLIVGIVSMILSYMEIIPYNDYFTPYTNPFNYIAYFLMGREYRLRKGDDIIVPRIILILSVFVTIGFIFLFKIPKYWNPFTLLFTIAIFLIFWSILYKIPQNKLIVKIGKLSMVLYLCHLQIAQALATRICAYLGGGVIANVIKVPVVFFIVVALVYSLELVLTKMKLEKLKLWLGYK